MADWPLNPPSFIRLDLFPAYVTRGNEAGPYTNRARVIITDRDLYVFTDSSEGPACEISGQIYDNSGDNKVGYEVQLDDGDTYRIRRSENCGCGSRLRGFRPFPGVPYQRG